MRDIRTVLVGDPPVEVVKPWDATVSVVVTTPSLAITDLSNMSYDSSQNILAIDTTGAAPFSGNVPGVCVGVAKSNINTSGLLPGAAIHLASQRYGLVADDSPSLSGMILLPSGHTAAEVGLFLHDTLLSGGSSTESFIITQAIMYGTFTQAATSYAIVTDSQPVLDSVTLNSDIGAHIGVGTGLTQFLLLGRTETGFQIGQIDVAPDGNSYDVIDAVSIDDNPVLPPGYDLFYYAITLDYSFGFGPVSIRPKIQEEPLGYSVTGTTYEAGGKTQADWDAVFPTLPTAPNTTTVTEAVFPVGTHVESLLSISLDPLVTRASAPYGHVVHNGERAVVTSVTPGSESFITLVDNLSITAALAGVVAAQAASAVALADVVSSVTAVNNSLTVAALNAPEIVIYVSNRLANDYIDFLPALTFTNVDQAYEYALTKPAFIRKRIVFDDRLLAADNSQIAVGTIGKKYWLRRNNIVLSTFTHLMERKVSIYEPVYAVNLTVMMVVDGFKLESFAGSIEQSQDGLGGSSVAFVLNTHYDRIDGTTSDDSLVVGDNCIVDISNYSVDFAAGGHIAIGHNSLLRIGFINAVLNVSQLAITKPADSYLSVSGNLTEFLAPSSGKSIRVHCPRHSAQDYILNGMDYHIDYYFTNPDPIYDFISGQGVVIIRHRDDFGDLNANGEYTVYTGVTYVIVGDVDLANNKIRNSSGVIKFTGYPNSVLSGDAGIFDITGVLLLRNLSVLCRSSSSYALTINGGVSLRDCALRAPKPLIHNGYNSVIELVNVNSGGPLYDTVLVTAPINLTGFSKLYIRNYSTTMSSDLSPFVLNTLNFSTHEIDIDVDGLDIVYYGNNNRGVFDITPPYQDNGTYESIRIRNVTTNKPVMMFSLTGAFLDHTALTSIQVDAGNYFADLTATTGGAYCSNPNVDTLSTYNLVGTYSGFTLLSAGVVCRSRELRRYLVRLRVVISTVGANQNLRLSVGVGSNILKSVTVSSSGTLAERTVDMGLTVALSQLTGPLNTFVANLSNGGTTVSLSNAILMVTEI